MSEKLPIALPSIEVTTCDLEAGGRRRAPRLDLVDLPVVLGLPKKVNRQVRSRCQEKFAIRAAATIAARGQTSCVEDCPGVPRRSSRRAFSVEGVRPRCRHRRIYIAAERDAETFSG